MVYQNSRCYNVFNFIMVVANLPLGFISAALRFVRMSVVGMWLMGRLDISCMNRMFEQSDSGESAPLCCTLT